MINGGVLLSQDISCAGQVSMSTALPILGACGLQPSVLPTAILSTHTGGFGKNTYLDLSNELTKIVKHWRAIDLHFNGLYLGYLGKNALDFWLKNINQIKLNRQTILIDPAMADHGKMYRGLDQEYVKNMRKLLPYATVLTPNMTEAAFLLNRKVKENTIAEAENLANELQEKFAVSNVVITGISLTKEKIAEVGITNDTGWTLIHQKQAGSFFGTGDIFASVLFASLLHDLDLEKSCSIAADFVSQAIMKTVKQDSRLGPNYAAALPELLKQLQK